MKSKNLWQNFLSSSENGFYINKFGPFKDKEVAEFFNFLAFGNPSDSEAGNLSKENIHHLEFNPNRMHPKNMFDSRSLVSHWCKEVFGIELNEDLILKIATSSGAKGYKAFSKWLINGCKVDGKHISTTTKT